MSPGPSSVAVTAFSAGPGRAFPMALRRSRALLLALCGLALPLAAQMPESWNHRVALGTELTTPSLWVGWGVWSAGKAGQPATLISSLGLGNSLVGSGVSLEGGFRSEGWSGAGKLLLFRDADGATRATLHQGHLSWTSRSGWQLGLENEPLVWGYGLTGGYLLGEAARPFPKVRLVTPQANLSLFGTSLGDWKVQAFLGKLESRRKLADNVQNPSGQSRIIAANGEPQAPLASGYRFEGSFYEGKIETYLNWTVLWGGNRNGIPMTSGYGVSDYLTAALGMKDFLAETSTNFSDPNHPDPAYKNNARSSTNFDFGVRGELPFLARWLGAEQTWGYISRGSKGMTWPLGVWRHKPLYWTGKDLVKDFHYALNVDYRRAWYEVDRHLVPNLIVPDDAFGLLVRWPRVRLGLERRSTSNLPEVSYRSFENATYATGFYRDGDPLGEAFGGETDVTTARLEWDATPSLATTTWLYRGARSFRDDPVLWLQDHPGQAYTEDYFSGLQLDLTWKATPSQTLRAGGSFERHTGAGYILGNTRHGTRWFLEWSGRWARSR